MTRGQLVAWMDGRLVSNFTNFDLLSSGEDYCKLLYVLCPAGGLPVRLEQESVHIRLPQQGPCKAGLAVRIEGIIASRFRNHYVLSKWFKKLFDETQAGRDGGACTAKAVKQGDAQDSAGDYDSGTSRVVSGLTTPESRA